MSTSILCRSVAFFTTRCHQILCVKNKKMCVTVSWLIIYWNHKTLQKLYSSLQKNAIFLCDTSWEGVSISCDYTVQQNSKLFFQKIQITLFSRGILTFFLPSNEQFLNFAAVKLFLFFYFTCDSWTRAQSDWIWTKRMLERRGEYANILKSVLTVWQPEGLQAIFYSY